MLILIALFGLMASTNRALLALIIALELLLLSTLLHNAASYLILNEQTAQVLIAFMITLAGAETSCALALTERYWKDNKTIMLL